MTNVDETELANIVNHAITFKFGGMSDNELMQLGRMCYEKNVLELGSMVGMSSYVIGSVAKHLDCIDMWEDKLNTEEYFSHDKKQRDVYNNLINQIGDMQETFLNNCNDLIKSKKIKYYKGKTTDIARRIRNKKYDIIVFDADHSYKGVSQDFYAYEKKLKEDGYYIFHDYGDSMWTGIVTFLDEMLIHNRLRFFSHIERIGIFTKVIN